MRQSRGSGTQVKVLEADGPEPGAGYSQSWDKAKVPAAEEGIPLPASLVLSVPCWVGCRLSALTWDIGHLSSGHRFPCKSLPERALTRTATLWRDSSAKWASVDFTITHSLPHRLAGLFVFLNNGFQGTEVSSIVENPVTSSV